MAPPYKRSFSFTGFQANQPRASLPGQRLDIELDEIGGVVGKLAEAVASLRPLPPVDTSGLQPALGFTPENVARRGQPNGYAPIGSDGKVPLTNLPDLGGGGGGPITASQITDGSASGRSVLTGTPAQGRAALEIAFGNAAGTYTQGNDPRLSAVSNPVYDRGATGGRSRTFTQIASDAISIMEFLTDAMIAGTVDAGPGLNACANYCRSSGRNTMNVPAFPGVILINTTLNITGVHFKGPSRGTAVEARFKTTTNIDTFFAGGPFAGISGIRHDHEGNGRHVNFPGSSNYFVLDCMLYAQPSSSAAPMISFGGSNVLIQSNSFTNLRPNAYSIAAVRGTDDIMIDNSIFNNYFGGPGKGILVASTGNYVVGDASHAPGTPIHRQEGLEISGNRSILFGGAFIEIASILSLRILNNMIDQAHSAGGIIFVPQGTIPELGTYGVNIIGNYISPAQDQANAIGIQHYTGSGNYVAGVMVSGNEICFCGEGAYFGTNIQQITFSANVFHSIAKQVCVRVANETSARAITFSKSNCIDGYGLKINTVNVNGQWRSTTSAVTATNDGNGQSDGRGGRYRYIVMPHLLAVAPAIETVQLQFSGSTVFGDAVCVYPIGVDNSNVTAFVTIANFQTEGTARISMKCAVNGPNS